MRTHPSASLASMMDRLSVVPRWRATSIALAAALLLTPLPGATGYVYHSLTLQQLTILAFLGLITGWIALDRMAALRIQPPVMVSVAIAITIGAWSGANIGLLGLHGPGMAAVSSLAVSFGLGGLIRGVTDGRRSMASLVAIAAATTWLAYEIPTIPFQPLRDFHLYLGAGATALGGASPYLTAPITSVGALDKLPFVYPPFTIPLFELLSSLPGPLADVLWEAGSVAAVIGGLWLLGVRGRWLLVLLAWPPLAIGIAVGNVASFTFLLYVAGFRFGAALVVSGAFKVQSMIPTLWLMRERRWRDLGVGVGVVALVAIVSVPIVGLPTWAAWPKGVLAFQVSLAAFPGIQGLAVTRSQGPLVAAAIAIILVAFALLARGRNALARFGLASVVGSPTLYLHGLPPLLAGALVLGPELLWFFLGLGVRNGPFGIRSAWIAMAMVGLTLLVAREDLRVPGDLTPARADMHPAARMQQVWPDHGGAPGDPADTTGDAGRPNDPGSGEGAAVANLAPRSQIAPQPTETPLASGPVRDTPRT